MIALVSLVFYGVSRLMKSTKANYLRIVTIVSLASLPAVLMAMLSPLLSKLHYLLPTLLVSAAYAYGTYILYECINNEAGFADDNRVKFATLSVLAIIGGVFILALAISQMTGLNKLKLPGASSLPSLKGSGSGSSILDRYNDVLDSLGD